jgi:hypothetical protein
MLKRKRADSNFARPLMCKVDRSQSAFRFYSVVLGVICLVSLMAMLAGDLKKSGATNPHNNILRADSNTTATATTACP